MLLEPAELLCAWNPRDPLEAHQLRAQRHPGAAGSSRANRRRSQHRELAADVGQPPPVRAQRHLRRGHGVARRAGGKELVARPVQPLERAGRILAREPVARALELAGGPRRGHLLVAGAQRDRQALVRQVQAQRIDHVVDGAVVGAGDDEQPARHRRAEGERAHPVHQRLRGQVEDELGLAGPRRALRGSERRAQEALARGSLAGRDAALAKARAQRRPPGRGRFAGEIGGQRGAGGERPLGRRLIAQLAQIVLQVIGGEHQLAVLDDADRVDRDSPARPSPRGRDQVREQRGRIGLRLVTQQAEDIGGHGDRVRSGGPAALQLGDLFLGDAERLVEQGAVHRDRHRQPLAVLTRRLGHAHNDLVRAGRRGHERPLAVERIPAPLGRAPLELDRKAEQRRDLLALFEQQGGPPEHPDRSPGLVAAGPCHLGAPAGPRHPVLDEAEQGIVCRRGDRAGRPDHEGRVLDAETEVGLRAGRLGRVGPRADRARPRRQRLLHAQRLEPVAQHLANLAVIAERLRHGRRFSGSPAASKRPTGQGDRHVTSGIGRRRRFSACRSIMGMSVPRS